MSKPREHHGLSSTPLYQAWRQMIQRCHNPKKDVYPHYGGRGIKVCERWRQSVQAFLEDMGHRPTPGHSLDRTDTNGDYEPGNCRWATKSEQASNRRTSRLISVAGEILTLKAASARFGVAESTLAGRLRNGAPVEVAVGSRQDYATWKAGA